MDQPQISSQIVLKSSLTPEQLRVQSLWHHCEAKVDSKTFLYIWQLVELGIPPHAIIRLLGDIAKYGKKRT